MDANNRRKNERYPARLEVHLETVDALMETYSRDISRGGVYVETARPLPVNSLVALIFYLPGEQAPLEVDGRVAHAENAVPGADPGVGVQFISLSTSARRALEEFVEHLHEGEEIA